MPFVRLTTAAPLTSDARRELASGITELMAHVLHKKRELTAVLVETPDAQWTIGGADEPKSLHLEASITAGTNTVSEKAEFLRAAMDLLRHQVGSLPEATYVVVREIPATDWGYDGRTQAARSNRRQRA